jgi:multiple sugar transport system ATP-binding protein
MARVQLKNVVKRWGKTVAVQALTLDVADGEFVVLLGPSGCGKTTTMRMVAGLDDPSEGEVWIGGRCVNALAPKDRDVAMVFQSYGLYPNLSVFDNIAFPLRMRGRAAADITPAVHLAATRVELLDYLQRRPKELSGGQRQRVALARAIVRQPAVFLMDEPLSNLDAKLRVSMRAHLKHLHHELRTTTLYVTHDQIEAMTLADRVVVMSQAQVQQIGTPEAIYNDPANLFVAGFVGSPPMNLIEGRLDDGVFTAPGVRVAGFGAATQSRVVLGVRAEDLVLNSGLNPNLKSGDHAGISGQVFSCELTGDATLVTLQCGSHRVTAKAGKDAGKEARTQVGQALVFDADAARCFVFDATTQGRLRVPPLDATRGLA